VFTLLSVSRRNANHDTLPTSAIVDGCCWMLSNVQRVVSISFTRFTGKVQCREDIYMVRRDMYRH
jgi:hypothetical protein